MILSWVLFTRSFRYSWRRFILVSGAIGVAVVMLLLFVGGLNGLNNRMGSISWQQTIAQAAATPQQENLGVDPLYVALSSGSNVDSFWRDKQIDITRIAASGRSSPQFQGLPTPSTGEYYVSPGLKKIIDQHPEDSVGRRFGEKLLGLIPNKYVSSPDELSVVSGMNISEAKRLESTGASVIKLYHINHKLTVDSKYSNLIMWVLYIGLFILLLPIILLVSVAERLGSSQREFRYAALRLMGASKRQIRRIMILESLVASILGIGIGLALYIVTKPLMLEFSFNGMRFWPREVVVPMWQIVGIIVATLVFTVVTNLWFTRRIQTSPLEVSRRAMYSKMHWWRIIMPCVGIGIVGFVASPLFDTTQDSPKDIAAVLIFASVIVSSLGLVIAGPYITQKLATLIARHTKHAEILLSMKYIAHNARGVFRSVSGVCVALFVGSFLLACATGMRDYAAQSVNNNGYSRLHSDSVLLGSYTRSTPLPEKQETALRELNYVHSVVEVKEVGYSVTVMSCRVATQYTSIQCPAGKEYAGVNFNNIDLSEELFGTTEAEVYREISGGSPYFSTSETTPNYFMRVNYEDIDKLRSFITTHYMQDNSIKAYLFDGKNSSTPFMNPIIDELAELSYVGIAITVFVAIISLAISTIGGLLERRRSLITLRLAGMTVGGVKRIIVMQSIVPLFSVTVIAAGFGLATGSILVNLLTEESPNIISFSYILMLFGCIATAIMMILLILPSVRLISDPNKMQTE
ncbi:MAG: ABC transporter permease [Actinobacteria bacterium]|nr:ABC transporter permease [Actinomycetota bacterium]